MIETVLIEKIEPNPFNPRKEYDADSIAELAEEIKANGVFASALRGRRLNGHIELCFGHRRLKAMRQAGIRHAEVDVVDLSDEQMAEQALVENIQRVDLPEIDKAEAVAKLCETRTQAEVARLLGLHQSTISDLVRYASLPKSLKHAIGTGKIEAQAAATAYRVGGTGFAEQICSEHISRPTVEKIASEIGRIEDKTVREKVKKDAGKGRITSAADVQKRAIHHSQHKPPADRVPNMSGMLITFQMNFNAQAETAEVLVPHGYAVRLDPCWKNADKEFSRLAKAWQQIRDAVKPRE